MGRRGYLGLLKKIGKVKKYMDVERMEGHCLYVLASQKYRVINYSNLNNMRDLYESMDPTVFENQNDKYARYLFITKFLEGRLEKGLTKNEFTLQYVKDHMDERYWKIIEDEIIPEHESGKITEHEILYINDSVYAQLNMKFLQEYKEVMMTMLEDINNDRFGVDAEDADDALEFFQSLTMNLAKVKRRSKNDNRFNLVDDKDFTSMLYSAAEKLISDSEILTTTWQGLNRMLGGGFENGRCYNFVGATGGFKSGLLLNIMKTIKIANRGKIHRAPGRRSTILFVSQENNLWETIGRIFGIFASIDDIHNFTVKEIVSMIKNGGFRVCVDEDDINVEFRYAGNGDYGVPDLEGMVEELASAGQDVICIIQDYIERMKAPDPRLDRRLQLADISNQMHDLAMKLEIPIITGSQYNRDGVAVIEEKRKNSEADIGKEIGTRHISESFAMMKNFDVNIGIVIEYDQNEGRYYLSFNKLKFRGADKDGMTYFLHPFVGKGSKIRLMDDMDPTRPMYRLTLSDSVATDMSPESQILTASRHTLSYGDENLSDSEYDRVFGEFDHRVKQNEEHDKEEIVFPMMTNRKKEKIHTFDLYDFGNMERNEDGFIILKYKVNLDFSGLNVISQVG